MAKVVLITGASSGLGLSTALHLHKIGYQVYGTSRNPEKNIITLPFPLIPLEITNNDSIDSCVALVLKKAGRLDVLINNAGKLINKPFTEISSEDFLEVYKVNVFGVAEITKLMIPFLQKGSHVVTISSIGGIQGSLKFPGLAAYSSAKGAVITLSELLAEEYKEQQIAFNVLALGAVQTEMLEEAFPGYQAPISASEMADYIYNFSLTGNKFYNGKVLQVSSSNP